MSSMTWRCLLCDEVFGDPLIFGGHLRTAHCIHPAALRQVGWESGQHTGVSIHEFNDPSGRAVLWIEDWHNKEPNDA